MAGQRCGASVHQAGDLKGRKRFERVLAIASRGMFVREDAERTSALTADRGQQVQIVAYGDSEATTHGLARSAFRQKVSEPRRRFRPRPRSDTKRQAHRDRERVWVVEPIRSVCKAELSAERPTNLPNSLLAEPHIEQADQGRCPRGTIQTFNPKRPRT